MTSLLGPGVQLFDDILPNVPDDKGGSIVTGVAELTGLEELQAGTQIGIDPDLLENGPAPPTIKTKQTLARVVYIMLSTTLVLIATLSWARAVFNIGVYRPNDWIFALIFTIIAIFLLYTLQPTT